MALEVRVLKCRSIAVEKEGESKDESLLFPFILSPNPCGIVGFMVMSWKVPKNHPLLKMGLKFLCLTVETSKSADFYS